jgi:predicted methyltransferase
MPTEAAPALLISGFAMHRILGTTPEKAAKDMVHTLAPIAGRVLDTATGLGYAAIEAARSADEVVTIELEPMAQQMAQANPWSQQLFDNPKVTQLMGDSFEVIERFAPDAFNRIVHDPPAINLAGDLYSEAFYGKALRILGRSGRLFHYIGDPRSKSGARVTDGVVRRLQSAGFRRVDAKPAAFGVVAYK